MDNEAEKENTPPQKGIEDLLERVSKFLNNSKEIIAIVVNIFTAVILFTSSHDRNGANSSFTIIVEILNVTVLVIAMIMLSRRYDLTVFHEEKQKLAELKIIDAKEVKHDFQGKIDRINIAVAQFIAAHKGFAIFLIFLYVLLFLSDSSVLKQKNALTDLQSRQIDSMDKQIERYYSDTVLFNERLNRRLQLLDNKIAAAADKADSLSGKTAAIWDAIRATMAVDTTAPATLEMLRNQRTRLVISRDSIHDSEDVVKIFSKQTSLLDLSMERTTGNKKAIAGLVVIIIENVFNILSAVFLFIAFSVLYTNTIEEDNRTSRINYWLPFTIAGTFIFFIFLTISLGFRNLNLNVLTVLSRVISGCFNGAGMALLFSRFISMEYFYKESDIWTKYFYYIGTIIILPVYAVVQPLYGLFDADVLGRTHFLKDIVLLLCLWGKIFFFLLVFKMLQNRWVHAYIFTLRFSENRIQQIAAEIHNITNINKQPKPVRRIIFTASEV